MTKETPKENKIQDNKDAASSSDSNVKKNEPVKKENTIIKKKDNSTKSNKVKKDDKWILYKKKLSTLKHKILINIFISISFVGVIAGIYFYDSELKKRDKEEIKKIKIYMSSLREETSDIKTKIDDAEKYKKSWESASDRQKDLSGIKMDKVNKTLDVLSKKYNLTNPRIKVSLPEILKESKYKSKSIDVTYSNVSLSYSTLDDSASLDFVKEFIDSLKGYVRVIKFRVARVKKESFTDEELVGISSGTMILSVSNSIDFSWYVLKEKKDDGKSKKNN